MLGTVCVHIPSSVSYRPNFHSFFDKHSVLRPGSVEVLNKATVTSVIRTSCLFFDDFDGGVFGEDSSLPQESES